jgi:hypothetical protein
LNGLFNASRGPRGGRDPATPAVEKLPVRGLLTPPGMVRNIQPIMRADLGATAPADVAVAHVAVLLPEIPSRDQLLRAIRKDASITVLTPASPTRPLAPVDVAVLHADSLDLACGLLFKDPDFGWPEIVFVVDEEWSPQHLALRSRGFRHVVSREHLSGWLPTVLAALSALARARRMVLDAFADGPEALPLFARSHRARALRLRQAETSFREAFMRSLLAECGSRREAAEKAGVPYRSFCEMLRKLGI